jgi:integrase
MAAYQAAASRKPPPGSARIVPGSMGDVIASYLGSPDFQAKAPGTRKWWRAYTDALDHEYGERPIRLLEQRHVRRIVTERAASAPVAANRLLSVLRVLCDHAIARGIMVANPAQYVRRVPHHEVSHRAWSEDQIARYEARWPAGSRARPELALLVHTGQRRSDIIGLGRQHLGKDGRRRLVQGKTKAALILPVHPKLRAELDQVEPGRLTFLTTVRGAGFASGNAFYQWFKWTVRAAGLPDDLSPHCLRHAAAPGRGGDHPGSGRNENGSVNRYGGFV